MNKYGARQGLRSSALSWWVVVVLTLAVALITAPQVLADPVQHNLQAGKSVAGTVVVAENNARLASSVSAGALVVRVVVLTAPQGVGPQDFLVRIAGPQGTYEVCGSSEGTVLMPVPAGRYVVVGQLGPANLEYVHSNNGPVMVPEGGSATLVITNAVPVMSTISTGPSTTLKSATTLPGSIQVPTVVHAGGGGAVSAETQDKTRGLGWLLPSVLTGISAGIMAAMMAWCAVFARERYGKPQTRRL